LKFLEEALPGCFVRIMSPAGNKYRLVEIIDVKIDFEAGAKGVYTLGKNKTSLLAKIKYGDIEEWQKLKWVSNSEPTNDEFRRMQLAFRLAKDKSEKSHLRMDKIKMKEAYLQKIKKQGGVPKYD
jgi:hypothetical protein